MPRARRSGSTAPRRLRWQAPLVVVAVLLLAGCADFAQQAAPANWSPAPTFAPESVPDPGVGGDGASGGTGNPNEQAPTSIPPPVGCKDFDPAVIATCLNPVSAVAFLPGTAADPVGLAAERTTGRILRVERGHQPIVVASLPVNTTGGGGLTGLALSPTYPQDQLIFAYVTTATDNRVLRIAPDDTPKPVLTGIPRGPTDNAGVIALDHQGELLVATGDAGDPAAASDPKSLAGKVLRIDVDGKPAPGNPNPASPIVSSGLVDPGGVCSSLDGSRAWVTDRTPTQDVLYRLQVGRPLSQPAWTWPNKPGVAGCVAFNDLVTVAMSTAAQLQSLPLNADGTFTTAPEVTLQGKSGLGQLAGLDIVDEQHMMLGTINRSPGGHPVSSDDRVAVIPRPVGAGGGLD